MTGGWGAGRTPVTHRPSSTRNKYVATTQSQNANRLMGGGSYDRSSEHAFASIDVADLPIADGAARPRREYRDADAKPDCHGRDRQADRRVREFAVSPSGNGTWVDAR